MSKLSSRELSILARRFMRERMRVWKAEKRYYSQANSLDEAIDIALGLRDNDRIPSHQCRVGRVALSRAGRLLKQRFRSLRKARNFEELHSILARIAAEVPRFGKLATYDIAHRLGIYFGMKPELVYLHAGTKEGASAIGIFGSAVDLKKFPKPLQIMSATQLEDFLCICKSALQGSVSFNQACSELSRSCVSRGSIC